MSDISVSERRLSAALDRIDQLLEAGTGRPAASPAASEPDDRRDLQSRIEDLQAENARLADELAALRADRGGPLEAALAEARTRLSGAGEQAARLAAANEELAAANRALIESAEGKGDPEETALVALEAEIEALRAARAAEIAQMGDIMQELERLLAEGDEASGPDGRDGDDTILPEMAGDSAGVPEGEAADGQDRDR
ncbi:hypothetical protein JHW45_10255 [Paracoccus stylophorae]|uniref:Uncharacterized protein n=1 Tax=Paracoccus stylophorae TaxID=659350 RepID=A0ABY7SRL6_9RHOB|nr:hypothetical protein [Paracoccus stylophorae]WCR09506.1 hypothetical protein JHW45_10255 [Paracoccus stylophorae]